METLLLFANAPVAGNVKARLAAARGEPAAIALEAAFLLDVADACGQWRAQQLGADLNRRVVVYASRDAEHPVLVEAARRAGARIELQHGSDAAARLQHAFDLECERGARAVCAIGADCPTLPAHLLDEAFRALVWERVVLGPTFDDACWLVGSQRPAPEPLTHIPWSSAGTLPRSVAALRAAGVEPHLLPFWYHVDAAADLDRLSWHAQSVRARHPSALGETWRALEELARSPRGGTS